jgi:glycosyltransferase involved in cell wall biosynthesis
MINVLWHGGTRVVVQLANYLAAGGHEVIIVCPRGRVNSAYPLDPRVRIKYIGVHTGLKPLDYPIFLALLPFAFPRRSLLLATFFVTYYPVKLAAILRGAPYLYFVQDVESKYKGRPGMILNHLCNVTYHDDRIIAANSYLKGRLLREFHRTSVSVQIGPASPFYRERSATDKRYDIIYFLRREKWKGLERFKSFLTRSMGRFACLCVSQDETLFESVRHPSVVCIKPQDDDELVSCIDSGRILLFTSHEEGFALPPLEAMARGVPPVLYRCGGPDAYIRDKINGFYVEDEAQTVATVELLLGDQGLYDEVSREARATASVYRMDAALEDLLRHLLDSWDSTGFK